MKVETANAKIKHMLPHSKATIALAVKILCISEREGKRERQGKQMEEVKHEMCFSNSIFFTISFPLCVLNLCISTNMNFWIHLAKSFTTIKAIVYG